MRPPLIAIGNRSSGLIETTNPEAALAVETTCLDCAQVQNLAVIFGEACDEMTKRRMTQFPRDLVFTYNCDCGGNMAFAVEFRAAA